jgi:hypothetical protein
MGAKPPKERERMTVNKYGKAGIVVAGYAAALVAAGVAVWLHDLLIPAADAHGGMSAFGDSILFLIVFGVLSLAPTALALYWLRPVVKFWSLFSMAALVLAVTGPAAVAICILISARHAQDASWGFAQFLGWLRIAGAPLLAVGFLICAAIAPVRRPRRALLAAAAVEVAVCMYFGVRLAGLLASAYLGPL